MFRHQQPAAKWQNTGQDFPVYRPKFYLEAKDRHLQRKDMYLQPEDRHRKRKDTAYIRLLQTLLP